MKSNLPTENCDCPVTIGHARNIHFICKVSRNVTSGYLFKKKLYSKIIDEWLQSQCIFQNDMGLVYIYCIYMWFYEFSFFVFHFFSCKFDVKRSIYSIFYHKNYINNEWDKLLLVLKSECGKYLSSRKSFVSQWLSSKK